MPRLPTALSPLPGILIGILLISTFACGPSTDSTQESSVPTDKPHVVVVLIDTFRPDHLGVFGHERETAPYLEALIRRSSVFRQAFSTSSWTAPSTSSLFTSLYPTRHGVTEGFLAHRQRSEAMAAKNEVIQINRLPAEVATLPELMREAGYTTLGVASNINIGSEIGFDRGFDRFEKMQDRSAKKLAARMVAWRKEVPADRPTFLYMHFNDVHEPYQQREPWFEEKEDELENLVSAYDSEISFLDQVLDSLHQDLNWDENTLLLLVSDHGEEFKEHGRIGHQFSLYDELMRVLFVVSGEGIPTQEITDINVSLIDAVPTLLDLLDLPPPEGRDGLSLAPFLNAESPSGAVVREFQKRTLFAHRSHHRVRQGLDERHLWAAVRGSWKWIESPSGGKLFDRAADPAEKKNLVRKRQDVVEQLEQALADFREGGFQRGEVTEVEIDEATRKSLEALGYVQ